MFDKLYLNVCKIISKAEIENTALTKISRPRRLDFENKNSKEDILKVLKEKVRELE